jgi:hypothetical protein
LPSSIHTFSINQSKVSGRIAAFADDSLKFAIILSHLLLVINTLIFKYIVVQNRLLLQPLEHKFAETALISTVFIVLDVRIV